MTGELRVIPCLEDDRFVIDRNGHVYRLRVTPGRARGRSEARWAPLQSLSLTKACNLARNSLRWWGPLVFPTTYVVRREYADGTVEERTIPAIAAEQVIHDPRVRAPMITPDQPSDGSDFPPPQASYVGGFNHAAGDTNNGWYCVEKLSGVLHLFHGPSVAAAIFAKDG